MRYAIGFWRRWFLTRWAGTALLTLLPALGCRHVSAASVAVGRPESRASDGPMSRDTAQPVEWIQVPVASGGVLRAAVARPTHGAGPFPVVLLLHGSHGFAEEYLRLARDLARAEVIAVAACWFQGGVGAGARFVTQLACPDAPPIVTGAAPAAMERVGALVVAISALPGARADRLALVGHSRGGIAALHYALAAGGGVRALVLNSAAYPPEVVARAPDLDVPVLLLHGTRDDPADGGSLMTAVERARAFEAALRGARKQVDVTYFDGGHNGVFTSAAQYDVTVRRVSTFLNERLVP